jgi:predicted O-methyltransferase YrrM
VPIRAEHVDAYLEALRPPRSALMGEMEALAERDGVPIVPWETGRFLASLVRALDPALVVEVGTAIGYSTLHMAEALGRGRIVTLERDPARAEQARGFLGRGGVLERVELVEGDALETLPGIEGPVDLLFLDATKTEYRSYLELAEPKLSPRAVLAVDNVLMSGEAALPDGADTRWARDSLREARALARELLDSERWLASILPIGDGLAFAARLAG